MIRVHCTHLLPHRAQHRVLNMDLALCGPLACSELRAALAGECADSWPASQQRNCVWSRALYSTRLVFPEHGAVCVDKVFHRCFASDPGVNPVPELALPSAEQDEAGAR